MGLISWREFVKGELANARKKHGSYTSAHEAYAVLLEEVDEFWEEVRFKRQHRDPARMLRELVQIATVAERAAYDLKLIEEVPECSEP